MSVSFCLYIHMGQHIHILLEGWACDPWVLHNAGLLGRQGKDWRGHWPGPLVPHWVKYWKTNFCLSHIGEKTSFIPWLLQGHCSDWQAWVWTNCWKDEGYDHKGWGEYLSQVAFLWHANYGHLHREYNKSKNTITSSSWPFLWHANYGHLHREYNKSKNTIISSAWPIEVSIISSKVWLL